MRESPRHPRSNLLLATLFGLHLTNYALGLKQFQQDYDDLDQYPQCLKLPDPRVMAMVIGSPGNSSSRPTAIVIAPNYILTVGHWGNLYNISPPLREVHIVGQTTTYKIVDGDSLWNDVYDLGVYRIKREDDQDANLSRWVALNTLSDELRRELVIGSFGPQQTCTPPIPPEILPTCAQVVGPGDLHWGRTVVFSAPASGDFLRGDFSVIGVGGRKNGTGSILTGLLPRVSLSACRARPELLPEAWCFTS